MPDLLVGRLQSLEGQGERGESACAGGGASLRAETTALRGDDVCYCGRCVAGKAVSDGCEGRVASGRECYARETLRRKAVESLQVVFRSSLRRPLFTFLIKNLKIYGNFLHLAPFSYK